MSSINKTTLTAAIALVAMAVLLGGCFSPDYGAGGFTCQKGKCPSGYECQNGVCRKGGTTTHDSSVDGPVADAPLQPDGLSDPDRTKLDQLVDAKSDLPAPDTKPDTKPKLDTKPAPDLKPLPDTTTPVLCSLHKVAPTIQVSMQPFDLALDSKNKPHLVYADTGTMLIHASGNPGSWILAKGPTNADRLAADFENPNTGIDVLHVIFREAGVKSPKLYHTYRSLGGSSIIWTKPFKLPTSPDVYYADIGAMAGDIYVVADGYATFAGGIYKPILNRWKITPGGAVYSYSNLGNMQSNEFHHVRVDVAKAGWGHTAWNKSTMATFWRTEANGSFTEARSISNANKGSSPAAVAVDHKGNYHHAFVRTSPTGETLVYGFWSGMGSSAVKEEKIYAGKIHPASVDIAVVNGLPYVTYARGGTKPVTFFSRMDSTNTWYHYKIGETIKLSPYTRVAVEITGSSGAVTLHVGYLDVNALIYAKCPVP